MKGDTGKKKILTKGVAKDMLKVKSKPKPKSKPRVLVAMSGGVDSSVAALLLKKQGYEVAGVFLHFWKDETAGPKAENRCCSLESLQDARAVAARIGIPLFTFDFSLPFKQAVVDYFLEDYAAGRTPNPCVRCNREIKIGRLLTQARALGYDYVATGHYLKIKKQAGEYRLYRACDRSKDQTYFLYTFKQEQLAHLLFPLGGYRKSKVRQLAAAAGLIVAAKAESQDICFLSGDHNNFLKRHLNLQGGDIILLEEEGNDKEKRGKKIGEHQGLPLYTIGQRRGLVGGTGPYYVSGFDYQKNILYVVKQWNEKSLYQQALLATDVNWLSGRELRRVFVCQAVIRYGHAPVACRVFPQTELGNCRVEFAAPQRAITPGQSIVFYQGERLLGGGTIVVL